MPKAAAPWLQELRNLINRDGLAYRSTRDATGVYSFSFWLAKCKRCTLANMPYKTVRTPMESIIATRPLEVVCMDYTKLERARGKEDVLVMTDVFTKMTVAVATKDQTTQTTARVLVKEWFCKFGAPA